jgi:hypothetical protein
MDQKAHKRPLSYLAEAGFILSPSARTGLADLGPPAKVVQTVGVLHLHPRGQARYPEGGRRREDEPREGVARSRQYGSRQYRETTSTRATMVRATNWPLAPATSGLSRSLADTPLRRSGHVTGPDVQIPKLIVRVAQPGLAYRWPVAGGGTMLAPPVPLA